MNKGEIYKLKKEFRNNYSLDLYKHPFIYWNDKNENYTGIMLTTSDKPEFKNIELKEEYFKDGYTIVYGKSEEKSKSFIVPLYLLKDVKYEHLEKVGELTEEGRTFITSIVGALKYTDWKSYMNYKK
jgi:hypothetical protein